MKNILVFFFLLLFVGKLQSQYIVVGQDTLFGNEWINFDQTYLKIKVAQDGIYRIGAMELGNAGVPLAQVSGERFQLWHNGEQVPIFTSAEGSFGSSDFIEFFGKMNTSELDRHLFNAGPDSMMMNPLYSLVTDTAAYFLTWVNGGGNLRYETTSNDLNNLPAKEEYYIAKLTNNSFSRVKKKFVGNGLYASNYDLAEGYSSPDSLISRFTLAPTSPYIGGPDGSLYLRFSGGNTISHQIAISLNDQLISTAAFDGFDVRQVVSPVPNSQLAASIKVKFEGQAPGSDVQRVSNIILTYPRLFDFENKLNYAFDIAASNVVKYVEINNFDITAGQPILYDLTNRLRIVGAIDAGVLKFALPASANVRSLYLVSEVAGAIPVNTLLPAPFIDFHQLTNDYIIVTGHDLLDDGAGNNRVQAYSDYRASQAGGAFDPIVVEVEQLYDQFSWGIERHPFSVRNFALFIKKNWSNPKYFFIVGKGREYTALRTPASLASAMDFGFYVPTYSFPGSDNLLLAGSDGFTPVIPVGRISAINAAEVGIYLDKVKEFEANRDLPQTIEDRAWMKRVLHMGGGLTPNEQSSIKSYLSQLENVISSSTFGGQVKSFYKNSSDPIQVSQTDQIFDYINNGTSIITFFGHSAVGTFDFSIDNPDNFNNKGKYPMLFSLGCYSGNIHTGTQGIGERFLFLKDKGAIVFGATAGQGFAFSLANFANKLYTIIGESSYGQGIGDALKSTIASYSQGDTGVDLVRQQFNLHGDPALKANPAPGPDYVVDASSVKFNPEQINTQIPEFELSFDVVNIGSYTNDSILVSIVHELPDGAQVVAKETLIAAPTVRTSMSCTIPTLGDISQGFNTFYVTVDKSGRVNELPSPSAELNNDLRNGSAPGITVYFTDNSVKTIYPTDFAIVGADDVELIASTSEPLLPERMYVYQIDTSELFNSPQLLTHKYSQMGGVLKWKPSINWQDSVVYYWRVSPDSISSQDGFIWGNSSFVYLENAGNGWNQSHFYQWKKDEFHDMELKTHGNLKFIDNFKDVFIRNAVNTVGLIELQINNAYRGRFWYNTDGGIYVTVFDSTSAAEWLNGPPYPYGLSSGGFMVPSYVFNTQTPAGRQVLIEFLRDVIPSKNYVLVYTTQANLASDYKPQDWESDQPVLGTDIFQILEAQGATLIRNTLTTGSVPYVFAYKKDAGPIKEVLADSLKQVLLVNFSIPGYWDEGAVLSSPVGPASSWSKLIWKPEPASNPEADTISVDLLAHDPATLSDSLLVANIQPGELDISNFSANDFPYLRLRFNAKDSLFRSSPQLDYWRILYEGVPDFAVNPSGDYLFDNDTLEQGMPLRFRCLVENLADYPGDSLLVKYSIRNAANDETIVLQREEKLAAHDTTRTHLMVDTKEFGGNYSLFLELNPADEQKELTRINNVLSTNFTVNRDLRNPLLDVTFDGIHILNGDLVSAKPMIRVALKDENPFLLLNDTNLIQIYLTAFPDSVGSSRRIYFDDPNLTFYPAQNTNNNRAIIELNPSFTTDGTYYLIVNGQDVSNNESGEFAHKIAFKVITKSSISNFLNYPNPFTTSTRFVYTMTGSDPPARYKLQIMTISGRIVRELTQDLLGPLKVGTHQTDYAWDGSDEYGDVLAKGVYLYRMMVQDETGKAWDGFETGADKYFAKGMGKMVLLR